MAKPKVFFNAKHATCLEQTWRDNGFEVAETALEADIYHFSGRGDINPIFYGETTLGKTKVDYSQDVYDIMLFTMGVETQTPMCGVDRGGQFLNVMAGGSLWQDVSGHRSGGHRVVDEKTGWECHTNSSHHQQMIPGPTGEILMSAIGIAGDVTKSCALDGQEITYINPNKDTLLGKEAEAIIYDDKKILCFQPHYEYGAKSTPIQQIFFQYVDIYFNLPAEEKKCVAL